MYILTKNIFNLQRLKDQEIYSYGKYNERMTKYK